MGREAEDEDRVERPFADHLVGDRGVAGPAYVSAACSRVLAVLTLPRTLIAEPGESIPRRVRYAKVVAVSELATAHCEVCAPGTPPLPEEEAARLSSEVPGLGARTQTGPCTREFSFPDFGEAFGLVARVALIAEAEGHHPDIELGWGRAAFRLTTHAASGLTRNDFVLAAKIDQLTRA